MAVADSTKTRGNLKPAVIYECEESGSQVKKKGGGVSINCMFNPFEYSVTQSHSYTAEFKNSSNVPDMKFSKAGEKSLSLKLTFDTYADKKDVSRETAKLWKLMQVPGSGRGKEKPPPVCFEWGTFQFFAVIKSVTQKFTLFLNDGTPVRAEVDLSFAQHWDSTEYTWQKQNPTSGGGPVDRIWLVQGGDRLDLIAAEVYGDATRWRSIAEYNDLLNPFVLRPGQRLRIPSGQGR